MYAKKVLFVLVVGALLASACGGSAPQPELNVQESGATELVALSATPAPAATEQSAATVAAIVAAPSGTTTSEGWEVSWFSGADLDRGDGSTFRNTAEEWNWRRIAPEMWPTFPNVPNPMVPAFRVVNGNEVPDGLEYAMDETNFCQQLAGEDCRIPVAARHYFYFTGDYSVPVIGSCEGGDGIGCMLVIVNVGEVTADFTGMFAQGFRLHARYWNGGALDMAIWALTSHGAGSMLNLDSPLNPDGITNAGANCSVPTGCEGVHVRVVFTSGNEPLVMYTTTVHR